MEMVDLIMETLVQTIQDQITRDLTIQAQAPEALIPAVPVQVVLVPAVPEVLVRQLLRQQQLPFRQESGSWMKTESGTMYSQRVAMQVRPTRVG